MSQYVGIDLGTTNSVVALYDGERVEVLRSPDQNDVTPSVILYRPRGNKLVGARAYSEVARGSESVAMLFKRFMGTDTMVSVPGASLNLRPEECSAEILRTLFGYLPEELRKSPELGTVITVPAAFNQMQKDATLKAAELAGIAKVAMMQEPVAAIMGVMHGSPIDGRFIIYDMGGGTLNVAVAQSSGGRVSLIAHGGVEMCGGRDFDRLLVEQVAVPWLTAKFGLPAGFLHLPEYRVLKRRLEFVTEEAKIALSAKEQTQIVDDFGRDLAGRELYIEAPLDRSTLDRVIAGVGEASVAAVRAVLKDAGFEPKDISRLVFVGGPTRYKPLRDRVSASLGIPGYTGVDPMTVVAEGAAIYAESFDWSAGQHQRKSARGSVSISGPVQVTFNFIARTPAERTRIGVRVAGAPPAGAEVQIDSLDTGWTSGRIPLRDGTPIDLPLLKKGENTFKAFVFDSAGAIEMPENRIVISRVTATIDAIPASHSIAIEALDKVGGKVVLERMVRRGDPLPAKGKLAFHALEAIVAGSPKELNFKIWEGDIEDRISENRFVGVLRIRGTDLVSGRIEAGARLDCVYEIPEAGTLKLEVLVPSIQAAFPSEHNFYSRAEGQQDFSSPEVAAQITQDAVEAQARVEDLAKKVADPLLEEARKKAAHAASLSSGGQDPEAAKQAHDELQEVNRLSGEVRKTHQKTLRAAELAQDMAFFDQHLRSLARPTEVTSIEMLVKTAERAIELDDRDFDGLLSDLRSRFADILWRQDWFIIESFKRRSAETPLPQERVRFSELVARGLEAMKADDMDRLRSVTLELNRLGHRRPSDDDLLIPPNIVRA